MSPVIRDDAAHVLALGASASSKEANDEASLVGSSGDGHGTALAGNGASHLFANGCTGVMMAINYVTGTLIVDGAEASTYTGTGIADTDGKGPICHAEVNDEAKVG